MPVSAVDPYDDDDEDGALSDGGSDSDVRVLSPGPGSPHVGGLWPAGGSGSALGKWGWGRGARGETAVRPVAGGVRAPRASPRGASSGVASVLWNLQRSPHGASA